MTLIKSVSGIRGTLGGKPGESLSPIDIVKFASGYAAWIKENKLGDRVIIGRDARLSGDMVSSLVASTLIGSGLNVTDLGLSTTPTVEMAVILNNAAGGIILTASHNPGNWNALKLLNQKGEFLSQKDGERVLDLGGNPEGLIFSPVETLGEYHFEEKGLDQHIEAILKLPLVNPEAIKAKNFRVAVDAVNSSGGLAVPKLLLALGVHQIEQINCEPTGHFAHNPEPLPEHMGEIMEVVKTRGCDLGIVVDPDVDRLALIMENGEPFGEEYTLVAVSDYILKSKKGAVVSNLSSSRALRDLAQSHGCSYSASPVGEVHVVEEMKKVQAVIGGEGNGGVIYPDLHYGRDALVGIALFLSYLAEKNVKVSELRKSYPDYRIVKNKMDRGSGWDEARLEAHFRQAFPGSNIDTRDGVKIDLEEGWVHLRKSNTEPIVRVYSESKSEAVAQQLAEKVMKELKPIIQN